jgi:cold shock CspA family protein
VENIQVVERKERPTPVVSDTEDGKENSERKGLSGFVTEVVPSRQFGFITAVDEQGSKTGEHIFFHFREVESNGGDGAQDGGNRKKSRGRSASDAIIHKGDEVKFDAGPGKNGKLNATKISILPRGTLKVPAKADKASSCTGYILMEPSHTSLANTPSHIVMKGGPAAAGAGGRWANVKEDKSSRQSGSNVKEEGVILLISDPSHLFSPKPKADSPVKKDSSAGEGSSSDTASENKATNDDSAPESNVDTDIKHVGSETKDADIASPSGLGMHLRYKLSSMAVRSVSAMGSSRGEPKRGDLVSFGKTRGAKLIKDLRIEKAAAATSVRGSLVDINKDDDTAVFVVADDDTRYDIKLTEVVSCEKSLLKDNEQVDGILHEGKIFGVCRTKDIYLVSSINRNSSGSSGGLRERPKLNLTVKKELKGMGGQIMAQSRMAKGPDGTNGFAEGWTKRVSSYVAKEQEKTEPEILQRERSSSLSAAANEFVPNFAAPNMPPIATSGFDSSGHSAIAASGFESSEHSGV